MVRCHDLIGLHNILGIANNENQRYKRYTSATVDFLGSRGLSKSEQMHLSLKK